MLDELPEARVHEPTWRRLGTFVMVGPRRATEGPLQWAISQALVSSLVHLGYFVLLALMVASEDPRMHLLEQILVGIFVLIAAVLFSGIQWMVILAAMVVISQAGWALVRLPRALGTGLGAVLVAAVALVIEPIGGLMYHALGSEVRLWGDGFWVIAAVLGALWGAWLPRAFRRSHAIIRDRAGS